MFEVTNIERNSDKEKYVYSGYGITFDGRGDWNFNNYTTRTVILGFDNSSSPHTDNFKNDFLILSEGPTFGINGSFGSSKKSFNINFTGAKTKICLSLHFNADNSYSFVNGKEIYKFKSSNKNNSFPSQFCPVAYESDSNDLDKVSFKENVYDFSVDCNTIDKSNNLNIHKYLMIKSKM